MGSVESVKIHAVPHLGIAATFWVGIGELHT